MSNTRINVLKIRFKFPVDVYIKYNGFLGILGYDSETDSLLINSKSEIDGEYANIFKDILVEKEIDLEALKLFLRENKCSMVFEVISPEKDPHIIKYEDSDVILLDVIDNTIEFSKRNYEELKMIGDKFELPVKEKVITLKSSQEFFNWYYEVTQDNYQYRGKYIEGFVIEDSNKFMVKLKLKYYQEWKLLRGVLNTVKKIGYIRKTSCLCDKLSNDFYNFCRENREELPDNIVEAREMFIAKNNVE